LRARPEQFDGIATPDARDNYAASKPEPLCASATACRAGPAVLVPIAVARYQPATYLEAAAAQAAHDALMEFKKAHAALRD
jgi:hypothetical protein